MKPELVTFDCAQTLGDVDWSIARFAKACVSAVNLETPEDSYSRLERLYAARLPEYLAVNLTRDPERGEQFWRDLTADWLAEYSIGAEWVDPLRKASDQLAFGPDSIVFNLFDDVIPCLDDLDSRGIRAAVLSNWDYTLHRVVDAFGLRNRFVCVVASLEEGVEKPDPRLFHICLERAGVDPANAIHVGDNPIDDVEGAHAAGLASILIDRTGATQNAISSLAELPGAIHWKS